MWESLIERWRELTASTEAWYLELFRDMGWVDPGQAGRIAVGATLVILLGGIAVLLWLALGGGRSHGAEEPSLAYLTRRPRGIGYAAVLLLLVGLGGWSSAAPLASAAIALGVVSPDGSRKTIQHFEGGIISAIHVREGDSVAAGQKLVTLEDI